MKILDGNGKWCIWKQWQCFILLNHDFKHKHPLVHESLELLHG
jgi:hypothetical protein